MKRTRIELDRLTSLDHLAEAAWRARGGKPRTGRVGRFFSDFDANLAQLAKDITDGTAPSGQYHLFKIHDPKPRWIHAPCFEDRVLHHALMALIGPRLEKRQVSSSFACLPARGPLAAVGAAQAAMRRFPWYVKTDMTAYFSSIDHSILLGFLARCFKGDGLMRLIMRILESHHVVVGKGLPIGALTSQYFGNHYLEGWDRFLLETLKVGAHVRYMDDTVVWVQTRADALRVMEAAGNWVAEHRGLIMKGQMNRCQAGMTFCGFRVYPGVIRLTRRRCRRYQLFRARWERRFREGVVTSHELQNGMASVLQTVVIADSLAWRKKQLRRYPSVQV